MPRYAHIQNCTHGGDGVTTVKSVDWNDQGGRLTGMGDKDLYPTTQMKSAGDFTGTVLLEDPVQARALRNRAEGTLAYQGVPEGANAALQVTIVNVTFFSLQARDAHNALAQRTVAFAARSPDGVTSPVTEVPVS